MQCETVTQDSEVGMASGAGSLASGSPWPTPFHRMHHHLVKLQDQNQSLRQEREARLERERKRQQDLVALNRMVAHDLRQPLNVISAYGQAIMTYGENLDDDCRGYLQDVIESTQRMNRLIGALVEYSRMGVVEPLRDRIDLSEVARGVIIRLQQGDPGRRVEVRIGEKISAYADYELLVIVLDQLLKNAWKFSGPCADPVIEFAVSQEDGGPVYRVRDNGVGMNEKQLARLFLPLQKEARDQKLRGFGLGLATVARIVERHGGRIWAESSPGQGACLSFTLGP